MTVKEIVLGYLRQNGYGGLHYDDCGCFDDDLMPCGDYCEHCEPAYKVKKHCDTCQNDACESRDDISTEWCLTTQKPAQVLKPCPECQSTNIK